MNRIPLRTKNNLTAAQAVCICEGEQEHRELLPRPPCKGQSESKNIRKARRKIGDHEIDEPLIGERRVRGRSVRGQDTGVLAAKAQREGFRYDGAELPQTVTDTSHHGANSITASDLHIRPEGAWRSRGCHVH
ncbi:MAG: hypothetical protein J1D88_01130 [Treponema sp.]|nr:hypothetical protein [Treponema sp.]